MFEKLFNDGTKVIIENGVIALYRADGSQVTNSNVDYYFEERGYGCKSDDEAANKYHENFAVV
jgi:hypothetical protein